MTQKEFDTKMMELNRQQYAEKHVYDVLNENINSEIRRKEEELDKIKHRIHDLRDQIAHNRLAIKNINIKYHEMKHQLCVDNPKDSMV